MERQQMIFQIHQQSIIDLYLHPQLRIYQRT